MTVGSGLFGSAGPLKPHLVQSHGIAAEVADLRADVGATVTALAALTVEEFTAPAAASVNAIKLAAATQLVDQVLSGAALDGAVGTHTMSPPRNLTVTTAGVAADIFDGTIVTFTGTDIDGNVITEGITITVAGSPGTFIGVKAFASVTSVRMPSQNGVGATVAFGFGVKMGLAKSLKARAGLNTFVMEIANGVKVTTATIASAAVGLPHGTYSPAAAPDGIKNYAIYYEYTP